MLDEVPLELAVWPSCWQLGWSDKEGYSGVLFSTGAGNEVAEVLGC